MENEGASRPRPQTFMDRLISVLFQLAALFFVVTMARGLIALLSDKSSGQSQKNVASNSKFEIYLSPHPEEKGTLLWSKEYIFGTYGEGEDEGSMLFRGNVTVSSTKELWLHAALVPIGPLAAEVHTSVSSKNLLESRPTKKTQNLMFDSSGVVPSVDNAPHILRNITVSVVAEDKPISTAGDIPPFLLRHIRFNRKGADVANYLPIVMFNEFWIMKDHYVPVELDESVEISLLLNPISFFQFQIQCHMNESFKQQQSLTGGNDFDDFKRMFSETSPILIAITFVVSLLHSLFDFLAFKNDIQFWKDRKNLEGLSVRSILINTASQSIIFLYLLDQETSWLILISVFVGLVIEMWKIKKALIVTFEWNRLGFIRFEDRQSYSSRTKEYDEQAVKYLGYAAIPLLFGYSIYSLLYNEHKGWYSYVLSTLVGFVYAFGFIMMTPQLFINYKLKSVAHMPWKAFMYKALNTFVDDLFAFVIKMPWLHRLACFRDDVLFLVYLYQRWAYPVDRKRVNEFGQQFEEGESEASDEKKDTALVEEKKDEQVSMEKTSSEKSGAENDKKTRPRKKKVAVEE